MAHEPGLAADLGLAHGALELGLGDERGHGVDDDDVHGARAHQHVGDVQGLLAVVGLGDQEVVGLHAQAPGVVDVQGVLGVDEGRGAAELLGLGDDVQGERGLAARFRPVDLADAPPRDAADAQGQIEADGAGGDGGDGDVGRVVELHHRALAPLALYGRERGDQGLAAHVFGRGSGFLGHGRLHWKIACGKGRNT